MLTHSLSFKLDQYFTFDPRKSLLKENQISIVDFECEQGETKTLSCSVPEITRLSNKFPPPPFTPSVQEMAHHHFCVICLNLYQS